MIEHSTKIRIRYAETDQMKTVYYANYFVYFEQARTELMRKIGFPYSDLENMGYLLPVIEAHAAYYKSVAYDDEIIVITTLKDIPSTRIELNYKIINSSTNNLIAEGYTIHCFVKLSTKKPTSSFIFHPINTEHL